MRLLADMASNVRSPHSAVAEFMLNRETGLWKYQFIRADKNRPNFAFTVLDTLCGLADGLSVEELQYRVKFQSPEHDDWGQKFQSVLKQIN